MGRARLPFRQSLQNAKKIPRRIVRPDAIAREESIHTEEKTRLAGHVFGGFQNFARNVRDSPAGIHARLLNLVMRFGFGQMEHIHQLALRAINQLALLQRA